MASQISRDTTVGGGSISPQPSQGGAAAAQPSQGGTASVQPSQGGEVDKQGYFFRDNEEIITESIANIVTENGDFLCSKYDAGSTVKGGGGITPEA